MARNANGSRYADYCRQNLSVADGEVQAQLVGIQQRHERSRGVG